MRDNGVKAVQVGLHGELPAEAFFELEPILTELNIPYSLFGGGIGMVGELRLIESDGNLRTLVPENLKEVPEFEWPNDFAECETPPKGEQSGSDKPATAPEEESATAGDAPRFSKPFQGIEAAAVSSVVLRTKDKNSEIKISDKEWTKALLGTITDRDFPLQKGPLGFSLPGELCSVEFRDGSGKALRIVTVFGAWNLLEVKSEGKSVLGSNRHFSDAVIRKLEESQPEYIQKQRETYGKNLSGRYEKEYRESLQGEQKGSDGGEKATD